MIIQQLKIENYKGINYLDVYLATKLNVFIGDNGVGKSSVLDLLAILLSRLTSRIVNYKGTGRLIMLDDIRAGAASACAQVSTLINDRNVNWKITRSRGSDKNQSISNLDSIKEIAQSIRNNCEAMECSIPLAILYATNRSVINVPLRIKKAHAFDPIYAYDDSLSIQRRENSFKLFFEWFRNREDLENELARDENQYRDPQLQAVRQALESLMPEYTDLKVKRNPLRMTVQKNNSEFRVEWLSDGEKCLIAMCGDMARRLAMANPGLENPLNGRGVIMIDELELHLHPQWQRRIVPSLLNTFPNCQFIVTTHSPQILSEIQLDNDSSMIFKLQYNRQDGLIECNKLEQAYGLEVGDILEGAMNTNRVNADVKNKLHSIFDLIDVNDFSSAKRKIAELKEQVRGDLPELVKAKIMISMLSEDSMP